MLAAAVDTAEVFAIAAGAPPLAGVDAAAAATREESLLVPGVALSAKGKHNKY